MMFFLTLMFMFLVGHAVSDYALQGDTMAKYKRRSNQGHFMIGVAWYYWLGSHALIHGGAVVGVYMLAIGDPLRAAKLGMVETLAHAAIDFGKCENRYGRHAMVIDQGLHVACKLAYVAWILG